MTVRIIHDQHGPKLITERPNFNQLRDVTFHGEDTIRDHPDHSIKISIRPERGKSLAQMIHIRVAVHGLAQALVHARGQPNRIDDACVVQLVGNDGVSRSAQGWEQRLGCRPTRHEGIAGLKAKE